MGEIQDFGWALRGIIMRAVLLVAVLACALHNCGCRHTCATFAAGYVDAQELPSTARRVQIRCDGKVLSEADVTTPPQWLDKCLNARTETP